MEGASALVGGDDCNEEGCVLASDGGDFRVEAGWSVEGGPVGWGDGEGALCCTVDEGVEGSSLGVAYSLFGDAKSRLRTSVEGSLL